MRWVSQNLDCPHLLKSIGFRSDAIKIGNHFAQIFYSGCFSFVLTFHNSWKSFCLPLPERQTLKLPILPAWWNWVEFAHALGEPWTDLGCSINVSPGYSSECIKAGLEGRACLISVTDVPWRICQQRRIDYLVQCLDFVGANSKRGFSIPPTRIKLLRKPRTF